MMRSCCLFVLLSILIAPMLSASTVRRWDIEATLVELHDSTGEFADHRRGDTVRGYLRYDLATSPELVDSTEAIYVHPAGFQVVKFVLESLQHGETKLLPTQHAASVTISRGNLDAVQVVESPDGRSGELGVALWSTSPADVFPDSDLPETLDLDDFGFAVVAYASFPEEGDPMGGETFLAAQILSLTPVETFSLAGDYNGDGMVGQGDLDLVLLNWGDPTSPIPDSWTSNLPTGTIDQDELDGVLLNWGNAGVAGIPSPATVPEPATLALTVFSVPAAYALRPKRGHRR